VITVVLVMVAAIKALEARLAFHGKLLAPLGVLFEIPGHSRRIAASDAFLAQILVIFPQFPDIAHEALEGAPPFHHVVGALRDRRRGHEALADFDGDDLLRAAVLGPLVLSRRAHCPPPIQLPSASSS